MASAKRDIRTIIDSFSDDLILIAQDLAREQVQRAVAEWQAKTEKVLAKKSVQDEKALRNQKALERIERAAEKRRSRDEKKAAERALRLEQRVIARLDQPDKTEKKPRGRRSGLLAESAVKKELTPPPLFVHKRRRDGEIQQLKRGDDEAATPNGSNGVASNGAAVNGAAANGVPVPGEQLRLGL